MLKYKIPQIVTLTLTNQENPLTLLSFKFIIMIIH